MRVDGIEPVAGRTGSVVAETYGLKSGAPLLTVALDEPVDGRERYALGVDEVERR